MLINRLGDGFILASLGVFIYQGHFFFLFEKFKALLIFGFLLGLLTKRAHFPFSSWLPVAMAAPTPVSALVHSSTLVTAGIYVLIRTDFFFTKKTQIILMILGLLTVFLGRFKALVRYDRKKVVAFSTLRNLGIMGVSLSLGLVGIAFFHLIAHGIRKALLFIRVGKFMKNFLHNQDLRKFSNK